MEIVTDILMITIPMIQTVIKDFDSRRSGMRVSTMVLHSGLQATGNDLVPHNDGHFYADKQMRDQKGRSRLSTWQCEPKL